MPDACLPGPLLILYVEAGRNLIDQKTDLCTRHSVSNYSRNAYWGEDKCSKVKPNVVFEVRSVFGRVSGLNVRLLVTDCGLEVRSEAAEFSRENPQRRATT